VIERRICLPRDQEPIPVLPFLLVPVMAAVSGGARVTLSDSLVEIDGLALQG
jgi:hypothetical protein